MKTKVKEIFHKGSASVVEWEDSAGYLHRTIIPTTEIVEENNEKFVEDVEEGPEYGTPWEEFILTHIGPKGIADLLRRQGIWTLEDYAASTATVNSVFNRACSENMQRFRENVSKQGR